MQGPIFYEAAKAFADERLAASHRHQARVRQPRRMRRWVGLRLINIGKRLVPQPAELQLEASTGPPCC